MRHGPCGLARASVVAGGVLAALAGPAWAGAVGQAGPFVASVSGLSSLWREEPAAGAAQADRVQAHEPEALALLGAGLTLLGLVRRRS